MGQYSWKYVESQQAQTITLYHGDTTGHVLITLNSKVLVIDFKVKETKSYSFFIDEEFCEVNIKRTGDGFSYTFEINKTIQTPLNERRKKKEKNDLWKTAGFFGLLISSIILLIVGLKWNEKRKAKTLHFGEETSAVIALSEEGNRYIYEIDGLFYENDLSDLPEFANDFPLENNDEFTVKYKVSKPEEHQIIFDNPSKRQLERYTNRAIEKQVKLSPENSRANATCLVKIGFEQKGISALADFYFQDKSENENPNHNENTYKRLIRSLEFQRKAKECLSY